MLLVGLFGSALSYLLFGLAGSLAVLFLARALAGVMGANIGVAQAYVADVTPPEERARGMGMIGAAFGLGFIFGPALGGLLSPLRRGGPLPRRGGARAGERGAGALRSLPESLRRGRRRAAAGSRGSSRASGLLPGCGGRAGCRGCLAAFFLLTFAFAALEATFSLWADRRWRSRRRRWRTSSPTWACWSTLVQGGLVGPLVRRLGERRLALLAGAAGARAGARRAAAGPLAGGLRRARSPSSPFGQGAAVPALSALISRRRPPGEQGRLLGVSQSLSALGRVLGPLWGGAGLRAPGDRRART